MRCACGKEMNPVESLLGVCRACTDRNFEAATGAKARKLSSVRKSKNRKPLRRVRLSPEEQRRR